VLAAAWDLVAYDRALMGGGLDEHIRQAFASSRIDHDPRGRKYLGQDVGGELIHKTEHADVFGAPELFQQLALVTRVLRAAHKDKVGLRILRGKRLKKIGTLSS
jgi:hypothetical protein